MSRTGTDRTTLGCADFVAADPQRVRAELDDPAVWRAWWPHLDLTPYHRRPDGVRWTVAGALRGTAEWWWESWTPRPAGSRLPVAPDRVASARPEPQPPLGVIVHWYLRVGDTTPGLSRRESAAYRRRLWAWKDALESRPAQAPR